jgi:hypothetical protein
VIVDDQQMLLAKIRESKPLDQYVHQYYNGVSFKARRDALVEATKANNLHPEQLILDALKDPFWNIRELAIDRAIKLKEDSKTKGIEIIKNLALTDPTSQVRAKAILFLVNVLEGKELENILIEKLEKDQSYLVAATSLVAIGKINSELALVHAKKLENEHTSQLLAGVGAIYSEYGSSDMYSFFEKTLKGDELKSFDQVGLLNSFTIFITRQEVDAFEKSVEIYSYLKEKGDVYTKMYMPQFMAYLQKIVDDKIAQLQEEIAGFEKSKDAVYANQGRLKIKRFEAVKLQFEALSVVVEK